MSQIEEQTGHVVFEYSQRLLKQGTQLGVKGLLEVIDAVFTPHRKRAMIRDLKAKGATRGEIMHHQGLVGKGFYKARQLALGEKISAQKMLKKQGIEALEYRQEHLKIFEHCAKLNHVQYAIEPNLANADPTINILFEAKNLGMIEKVVKEAQYEIDHLEKGLEQPDKLLDQTKEKPVNTMKDRLLAAEAKSKQHEAKQRKSYRRRSKTQSKPDIQR